MPVIMTGMSSSIGCSAKRVPRTVVVDAPLAIAFERDARQDAGRNVRSSNVASGRGRRVPKPRMR